ncbi:MAG: hypothetical protein ABSG65_03445, partial [Bryobacteraceae bacterium]
SGLATFIVVNSDGWILTAAHVLNDLPLAQQHFAERQKYDADRAAIAADLALSKGERKKRNSRLVYNPKWITNQSFWWGCDNAIAEDFQVDPIADVAIARLRNVDLSGISRFPVFKNPSLDPPPAGSLCRLGFPFVTITATFDENSQRFALQNFTPPPLFPNDGIHTRIMVLDDVTAGRKVKFIETSTPGLMGQSGGPLFDVKGEIWGVQSRTAFLELGFTPKTKEGSKEIVEHQFMNVGMAAHIQHVVELFNTRGVAYQSA